MSQIYLNQLKVIVLLRPFFKFKRHSIFIIFFNDKKQIAIPLPC